MGLADRLERGDLGLRFRVHAAEILDQAEHFALLVHREHQVLFELVHHAWRLDGGHTSLWRAAIERHARLLFDASFREPESAADGPLGQPRTQDAHWSPLIEFAAVERSHAFWILLRRSYAPGDELVEGRLLLPIVTGLVTLSLRAQDRTTGYRESALALQHGWATNRPWPQPTQARFDDARHDLQFPDHCLSRVRRARQWLLDANAGALERTEPVAPPAQGTVVLEAAGCMVTPPPRFQCLPAGSVPLSPGVARFSCVVLGGEELPRLLDVQNLQHCLSKAAAAGELAALARVKLTAYSEATGQHPKLEISEREGANGPEAHVQLSFVSHGVPRQEHQIWFSDVDRSVFKIGVDAPPSYPAAELANEVAAVRQSWRRLGAPRAPVGR